ncbi:ECF transporter S component [Thermosediminibacter litoriperuensis]|uniref:Energy-coupling factor transport system substrate-specific component n=1 Tax=Thermosediminibacter litoriperuensis TaxID=291989 RepID=A0A5S5AQA1_9FIRM|nr:ECF transporter S component [Thermosediminibacter litoriperuensis]TYP54197.1 energy-coupling factor transport system substrate-specific component [Thermosediminibacter litoriperuensis]
MKKVLSKILFWSGFGIIPVFMAAAMSGKTTISGEWGVAAYIVIFAAIALMYLGFELETSSPREIAVIAVLGAVGAAGRIAFAALPNVQPTTFIAISSGYVFGPTAGFMVGSTAALVSNFFLGQGPWTPWQMFAWGLAGSSAGMVKSLSPRIGRWGMAFFCLLWGYFFGWILNLWSWIGFVKPLNWQSFIAVCAASFWFDTLHAAGNAAFCLLFGPGFMKILERFRHKMEVT